MDANARDRLLDICKRSVEGLSGPTSVHVCALQRASRDLASDECYGATAAGKKLGFSNMECYGIMDGWDTKAGNKMYFRWRRHYAGYAEGFELGQQAYEVCFGQSQRPS